MLRKTVLTLAALLLFMLAFPALAEGDFPVYTSNKRDTIDDFDFEFWIEKNDNSSSMTLTGGGTFKCEWTMTNNALFRMGKRLGSKNTYEEYGDVIVDYGAEHNITLGQVSYLCIYGWTQGPLVEFYVIDNRGNYSPGKDGFKGTIEVDGGIYDVYEEMRISQPSIEGTKTFPQYFSIRRENRTEGTITVSDHFKAWEELGLDMSGNIYEVSLCVEAYMGSGNAHVYSHQLTLGSEVFGGISEKPPAPEVPDEPEVSEPPAQPDEPAVPSPEEPDLEPVTDPAPPAEPSPPDEDSGPGTGIFIMIGGIVLAIAVISVIIVASRKKK